jgi:hypothetical protein
LAAKSGLGSVGRDIFGFRPVELVLALGGSVAPGDVVPVEGLRLNHFPGLVKKFVNPLEGEADRETPGEGGLDDVGNWVEKSCGLN